MKESVLFVMCEKCRGKRLNDTNSLTEVTQIVIQCIHINDESPVDDQNNEWTKFSTELLKIVRFHLMRIEIRNPNKNSMIFVLNSFSLFLSERNKSFTWIYSTLCTNLSNHCWLCSLLPVEFYCFKTMASIDREFASFCCAVLLIANEMYIPSNRIGQQCF